MSFQIVYDDTTASPSTTDGYKTYAKFKVNGPIQDLRVEEDVLVTEDGTAGLATPGFYNYLKAIKLTVGGEEYPLLYGPRAAGSAAVAEAWAKGPIEDLSRFLLNQSQGPQIHGSTDGKGITKSSSSAKWGWQVVVPVGISLPEQMNKDCIVEIQHNAKAAVEGGTTHTAYATMRTRVHANYVDSCPSYKFAADIVTSIGASTAKPMIIPDRPGYFLNGVIVQASQASAGTNDIDKLQVKKGNTVVAEMNGDAMRQFMLSKSSVYACLIGQSASTAYAQYATGDGQGGYPINKGVYTLPLKETLAEGLSLWAYTNASASSTQLDVLYLYVSTAPPGSSPVVQKSENVAQSSQGGAVQTPGAPSMGGFSIRPRA